MSDKKISLKHIKRLMFEFDINSRVEFDILAPADEYDSEAEIIWKRINESESAVVDDAIKIIEDVMLENHGKIPKHEFYEELAREILGISKKHLCPVCRKSFFEERDSFDICEECGWEDDSQQGEELTYAGGANALSVIESQVVYFMLNREELKDNTNRLLDQYSRDIIPYHSGKHSGEFKERTKELVTQLVKRLYRDDEISNMDEFVEKRVYEILNYKGVIVD